MRKLYTCNHYYDVICSCYSFFVCNTYMRTYIKIYAEPLGYWKNYYNLFDFAVLVISVLQSILTALNFGQTGLTVLRVVRGLKLIC